MNALNQIRLARTDFAFKDSHQIGFRPNFSFIFTVNYVLILKLRPDLSPPRGTDNAHEGESVLRERNQNGAENAFPRLVPVRVSPIVKWDHTHRRGKNDHAQTTSHRELPLVQGCHP